MKRLVTAILIFIFAGSMFGQANFNTSLHKTREGKKEAYKIENGGMETITGIPMENLSCGKCHSTTGLYPNGDPINTATYTPSCNDCHNFSAGNAVGQQTCVNCHNRQNYEMQAYPDTSANGDVHRKAGMVCIDCHSKEELHGDDGVAYVSLKQNGAVKVECEDCHTELASNTSHNLHASTVDCSACHAVSVLTCAGCHFESVVASGKNRAINQLRNYRLLVKKNDEVRLGGFMTHSYNGKTNYIISSYHSHVIKKDATTCADCHFNMGGTNAAIAEYNSTGFITMTKWNPTTKKIIGPSGVVPIPGDWKTSLKMDYVTYTGDPTVFPGDPSLWELLKSETDNSHLFYAEPLDSTTLAKLGVTNFPIPVELTSFTAEANGASITLKWTTATETNNMGFEIERKLIIRGSQTEFTKIGFISGAGTTTEKQSYNFNDNISGSNAHAAYYRLKQVDYDGTTSYSEIAVIENILPAEFSLAQNYPNPFNPNTAIEFSLPVDSKVTIKIYNSLGSQVALLVNEIKPAGKHTVTFNANDLSSGVYYYKIEAADFSQTKKMILLR
jgi:hypothetical protein